LKFPNFTGARLTDAIGIGANLRGGNYTEADLSRADLTEANLEGEFSTRPSGRRDA